jgi:membrane protein YdbS with pleckstrin-like domain
MKTIINTIENRCQLRQARTRLDGVQNTAAELFRDPTLRWRPVSPRLATERRIPAAVAAAAGLILIPIGLMVATEPFDVIAPLVGLFLIVGAAIGWVTVGRVVRTWGYAERDEDLLVTRGRLYRRLTVIPYGRMQVIEVRANPVSAWLDIATVQLVTASASTDATIPGLPTSEAHALRDRLAAKGEATTAGL